MTVAYYIVITMTSHVGDTFVYYIYVFSSSKIYRLTLSPLGLYFSIFIFQITYSAAAS